MAMFFTELRDADVANVHVPNSKPLGGFAPAKATTILHSKTKLYVPHDDESFVQILNGAISIVSGATYEHYFVENKKN